MSWISYYIENLQLVKIFCIIFSVCECFVMENLKVMKDFCKKSFTEEHPQLETSIKIFIIINLWSFYTEKVFNWWSLSYKLFIWWMFSNRKSSIGESFLLNYIEYIQLTKHLYRKSSICEHLHSETMKIFIIINF